MIWFVVGAVALFPVTWFLYVSIMHIKRVRDELGLHPLVKVFAFPFLLVGIVLDVLTNWVTMTFLLLELPRECLTTTRLQRHFKEPFTWRGRVAVWLCGNLLEPFDPGHCSTRRQF